MIEDSSSPARTLVLLHGLGRTPRSLRPIARAAARRGWRVRNVGYPSRRVSVASLAAIVGERLRTIEPGARLDFVTHSLGGIVLRAAVSAGHLPVERVGRVVMLAPPNQGSELADALAAAPLVGRVYSRFTGPAGRELGTAGTPGRLPPVAFDVGVIAGRRSLNPLFSVLLPRPNDGKVSVARAAVSGMREMLVVPHTHTFLMHAPAVIAQTLHFLEHGEFAHDPGA